MSTEQSLNFLKGSTNARGCRNVILFYSNHRRVSANNISIFRVVRTRIQIQRCC